MITMLGSARRTTAFATRMQGQWRHHRSQSSSIEKSQSFDLDTFSGGTIRTISEREKEVIEDRQLRFKSNAFIGVPAVSKCRHGFPQAVLSNPVGHSTSTGWKPVSGICRLTCPHLVKSLDEYEAEGAVAAYNQRLRSGEATTEGRNWPTAVARSNQAHRALRRALMSDSDIDRVEECFGAEGKDAFMQSGVAGMSPTKLDDVKCLHAQLGDYLLRGDNVVGEAIVSDLAQRGLGLDGIDECLQQCDVTKPEMEGGWSYMSVKNGSKLRVRNQRRSAAKAKKAF